MKELICKLLGHNWVDVEQVSDTPACKQTLICKRCGKKNLSINHDWGIWQKSALEESKFRICDVCNEKQERKIHQINENLGISFELPAKWIQYQLVTSDWFKKSRLCNNSSFITSFKANSGLIEIILSDSWESNSPSLLESPSYNRASKRQYLFESFLKELEFKKFQFHARAKSTPEYNKMRRKLGPTEVVSPNTYIPVYFSSTGGDLVYGNILVSYQTRDGKRDWILLCTIGDKNIYFRFTGNFQIEEDLQVLLDTLTWKRSIFSPFNLWQC